MQNKKSLERRLELSENFKALIYENFSQMKLDLLLVQKIQLDT